MIDESTPIPDKLFFRIGEVSQLVGVEPYVLRYWESEFPGLSPKKSSTGQRMFRRKDVELLLNIKHLLYHEKFTIEGARKALKASKSQGDHWCSGSLVSALGPTSGDSERAREHLETINVVILVP